MTEEISTPTRPVDNVIPTKGLLDRNVNILVGTAVENKGKLILTEILTSAQKHIFCNKKFFDKKNFDLKIFSTQISC